jgi:hypothetical protein
LETKLQIKGQIAFFEIKGQIADRDKSGQIIEVDLCKKIGTTLLWRKIEEVQRCGLAKLFTRSHLDFKNRFACPSVMEIRLSFL